MSHIRQTSGSFEEMPRATFSLFTRFYGEALANSAKSGIAVMEKLAEHEETIDWLSVFGGFHVKFEGSVVQNFISPFQFFVTNKLSSPENEKLFCELKDYQNKINKINKIGLISSVFFPGLLRLKRFHLFKPHAVIMITHNNDNFIPKVFLNRKIEERDTLRAFEQWAHNWRFVTMDIQDLTVELGFLKKN